MSTGDSVIAAFKNAKGKDKDSTGTGQREKKKEKVRQGAKSTQENVHNSKEKGRGKKTPHEAKMKTYPKVTRRTGQEPGLGLGPGHRGTRKQDLG